jgi:uncharacterized protein
MAYEFDLGGDEKREILRIARATAGEYLRSGRVPPGKPHRRSLLAGGAACVALRAPDGTLRGFGGTRSEDLPLYRTVQDMAVAAATRNDHLPAISPEDLEDLIIEVSVLGSSELVRSPDQVELGRHGLALTYRGRHGLLLPQTAGRAGWTVDEFLARVCTEAEVPDDSWRQPDATLECFTAQVFDESEYPPLDPQVILEQLMNRPS